jgi:hypothetical protein
MGEVGLNPLVLRPQMCLNLESASDSVTAGKVPLCYIRIFRSRKIKWMMEISCIWGDRKRVQNSGRKT